MDSLSSDVSSLYKAYTVGLGLTDFTWTSDGSGTYVLELPSYITSVRNVLITISYAGYYRFIANMQLWFSANSSGNQQGTIGLKNYYEAIPTYGAAYITVFYT